MTRAHRSSSTLLAACLILTGMVRSGRAGEPPSFVGLGRLPQANFGSRAVDISADGSSVLGNSDEGQNIIAFRWRDGAMISLGELGSPFMLSEAGGISADGAAAGGMSFSANGTEAFRWINGVMSGLGDLPGGPFYSHGFDISGDGGSVVGISRTDVADYPFLWRDGVMINLSEDFANTPGETPSGFPSAISTDGTTVVGYVNTSQGPRMFRWRSDVMAGIEPPPKVEFVTARGVSADGEVIVGSIRLDSSHQVAFRWENGAFQVLGDLPGGADGGEAMDVSADGNVIVGRGATAAGQCPFVWDAAHGLRELTAVLVGDFNLDLAGWTLSDAVGVSDDGLSITGNASDPQGKAQAWLAHIGCAAGGDVNNDGVVDGDDVPGFVNCLIAETGCGCANFDGDPAIGPADLSAFVDELLAG